MLDLISAECVEGVGPKSGKIRYLRMLFDETETMKRLAEQAQKHSEKPGSIISGASQTVYRQSLPTGAKVWTYKPVHGAWNRSLTVRMAQ